MALSFENTDLSGRSFSGSDLREASFHRCRLDRVDFSDVDLSLGRITQCEGVGAVFRRAKLVGVRFHGLWHSFQDGPMVAGSILTKCDFEGADLSNALLAGVDLTESNLANTVLRGTDFRGTKSELPSKVALKDAKLSKVKLTGVIADSSTVWPLEVDGTKFVFDKP